MENLTTPMMRQYRLLQRQHPGCLLLFRCGDFYETYFEDAEEAGRILNIVVTRKTAGADGEVAMAGVPYHAIDAYLAKLVRSGRSVAIAEQMEDPKKAKGLVRREVVRVVTPGTALEPALLEDRSNNYLLAIAWKESAGGPGAGFGAGGLGAGAGAGAGAGDGADFSAPAGADSGDSKDWLFSPAEMAASAEGGAGATGAEGMRAFGPIFPKALGAALVDLSTGAFAVTEFSGDRAHEALISELVRLEPREVLAPEGFDVSFLAIDGAGEKPFRITRRPADRFDTARARRLLARQLGVQSLEGYGAEDLTLGLGAAGAILDYLHETQKGDLPHIHELRVYRPGDSLILDATTQRSLEIVRNLHTGRTEGTLLSVLDQTRTAMGGRMLRQWLLQPLGRRAGIEERLEAVGEFVESFALRSQIAECLKGLPDLERVCGRAACARAGPRDLAAIRMALERLPRVSAVLESARAPLLAAARQAIDPIPDLTEILRRALEDEPPLSAREGGVIRTGWNAALDELKLLSRDAKGWIAAFRARESQRLGMPNLKVGFNKVFGYFIELTKAQMRQIGDLPVEYIRKQTIATGERFITPELKEKEDLILHAEERINEMEAELFESLRREVAARARRILAQAQILAQLDVLLSLGDAALSGGYARPQINEEGRIEIRDSRHPVLEAVQTDLPFVPNDILLDPEANQIALITGPNMAGKSTYIRQAALIVLMAHAGSFVPAREADIPIVDRIFTRVGAMDHLARGQSTFLVEMLETANILNNATDDSLVILDEIGRGTSTYDGMSIAWAVLEHLHNTAGRRPKTLFATHYHELTSLEGRLPRLRNFNVAVLEEADKVVFLYKIIRGPADRSYGIHAAKLAGIPAKAIRRARQILKALEGGEDMFVDSGGAGKAGDAAGKSGESASGEAGTGGGAGGAAVGAGAAAGGGAEASGAGRAIRIGKSGRKPGRLSFLDDFETRRATAMQLSLFDAPPHPALQRLRQLAIDRLTPLDALNLLNELKRLAEK